MSTLSDEPLIGLTAAAHRYPGHRQGSRLHPATLTRWILKGVRGLHGRIVRLEAMRLGCRWVTSDAALQRFATALASPSDAPVPPRSASARTKASAAAARKLEQMGA